MRPPPDARRLSSASGVGETAKKDQYAENDRCRPVVRQPGNEPEDSNECKERHRHWLRNRPGGDAAFRLPGWTVVGTGASIGRLLRASERVMCRNDDVRSDHPPSRRWNPAQNRLEHRSKTGSRTQHGRYWEWFYKAVPSSARSRSLRRRKPPSTCFTPSASPPNVESGHGNALQSSEINTILRTDVRSAHGAEWRRLSHRCDPSQRLLVGLLVAPPRGRGPERDAATLPHAPRSLARSRTNAASLFPSNWGGSSAASWATGSLHSSEEVPHHAWQKPESRSCLALGLSGRLRVVRSGAVASVQDPIAAPRSSNLLDGIPRAKTASVASPLVASASGWRAGIGASGARWAVRSGAVSAPAF